MNTKGFGDFDGRGRRQVATTEMGGGRDFERGINFY